MKINKLKLYNILMYILILVIVITLTLIVMKYALSYKNEKYKASMLTSIYDTIHIYNESINNPNTVIREEAQDVIIPNLTYKGYPVIGIIKINKINLEYPIIDDDSARALNQSIVKYAGCNVGEIGNICLAGHNNLNDTMFGKVDNLEIGDVITLISMSGEIIEYKILQKYVTVPEDIGCIRPLDKNKREVTLITCTNRSKNRLIIKAQEI